MIFFSNFRSILRGRFCQICNLFIKELLIATANTMPSIGIGRTLVHQLGTMDFNNSVEGRCKCCPYGYHIDLDFVPFTKKMLSREGDFERLKQLKDKWRSDRKSMDKLLGVDSTPSKIVNIIY